MLGVAVFFVIIGFISVGSEKRRAKASAPEAIIAQDGLFFKNTLTTWNNHAISYPGQESSAGDIIRYFNLPMTQERWERMRQVPNAEELEQE